MTQFCSFWGLNKHFTVYTPHIFFIHLSVDGHLGCLPVLATVSSAAMDTGEHVSLWIMVFSAYIRVSIVAQLGKNPPAMWETWVWSLGWEDPLEKGKAYPLQYSGLENSMNFIVPGVAKGQTRLGDFHSLTHSKKPRGWYFRGWTAAPNFFLAVFFTTSLKSKC